MQINNSFETKTEFELSLIYQERIGDLLFLVGTLFAILSTYQAEHFVISKVIRIRLINDNSVYTSAIASWFFFIASLIFAHVAIIRLKELNKKLEKDICSNQFPEFFKGSQISTTGSIIKAVGFALAAIGNQIKANSSTQKSIILQ